MKPLKIVVQDNKLQIRWDDQSISIIPLDYLRGKCPCADCGAEREKHSSSYFPIFTSEQISIEKISMVGHYAITIKWKDGHSTGVYEYNYLVNISKTKEAL
ncbi:MAG: DUF971 domain-containing protein [Bacteroidetes bacterium]|nr:DUF971 domain-containing protein [Bacteroidota bacterium]